MIETGYYKFTNLEHLYYGPESLQKIPKILKDWGCQKSAIISTKSLIEKTDLVKKLEKITDATHTKTLGSIAQHSPIKQIKELVEQIEDLGLDSIIAIGGGSPIDGTKFVNHLYHEKTGKYLKYVAVPTTLSAAEYTTGAGYTNEEGVKEQKKDPAMCPGAIILDPGVTMSTPERLWVSTGMRAIDHAIESLYRPGVPVFNKRLCYAALEDLFRYLPLSKANPENLEYRNALQVASAMSIFPLQMEGGNMTPWPLSHVLGHQLGATYEIPHGITTCITLSKVVRMKAKSPHVSAEDKEWVAGALPYIRRGMGVHDVLADEIVVERQVEEVADRIQKLVDELGLHSNLKDWKVGREEVGKIVERVTKEEKGRTEKEEIERVLEECYDA
ncbi:hypothetical protein YB2330_005051 [Saitoella coloradoensis]